MAAANIDIIDEILKLEWEAFQSVNNEGGRASCQDDHKTFEIMRVAQFLTWGDETLGSYLLDLVNAKNADRNLMEEKYARMMASTAPERYREFAPLLPPIPPEKKALIEENAAILLRWQEEYMRSYPRLASRSRPLRSGEDAPDDTSFETYMRGELATYSEETLRRFLEDNKILLSQGVNAAIKSTEYTAYMYGYKSLDEAEGALA
jgi:hypothetical protein